MAATGFAARGAFWLTILVGAIFPPTAARADSPVRVCTYNIFFLKAEDSDDRKRNLREVVRLLDAHVIGLQEIADRAALRAIFPADTWQIVIDDDSEDAQDLALAVRSPVRVKGTSADVRDIDAGDEHFLFEGAKHEPGFSNRRDLLCIELEVSGKSLWVMVHHAKSRREGRHTTTPRRVFAARELSAEIKRSFADRDFILLGDFNDTPDDASLNVLETGDAEAAAELENRDGPLMVNLCEGLAAQDRVSLGLRPQSIEGHGDAARINTVVAGSRKKNFDMRGEDGHSGPGLFDQVLIPIRMRSRFVPDSARIFDRKVAILGGNAARPSDHLPVYADFRFD